MRLRSDTVIHVQLVPQLWALRQATRPRLKLSRRHCGPRGSSSGAESGVAAQPWEAGRVKPGEALAPRGEKPLGRAGI